MAEVREGRDEQEIHDVGGIIGSPILVPMRFEVPRSLLTPCPRD